MRSLVHTLTHTKNYFRCAVITSWTYCIATKIKSIAIHQLKCIFWYFHKVKMSDARFIWTAWISNIILLENNNIKLFMCFKIGTQLHLNNCLAYKLLSKVINWSLGSFNFTNIILSKTNCIFNLKTQTTCTNKYLPHWG